MNKEILNQPQVSGKGVHNRTMNKEILKQIPKLPQRSDATFDQLQDLMAVATRLGMYDAADIIQILLTRHNL